jgi:hypothetical protein
MTITLHVLADGRKLPPYVILRWKTIPQEKLPAGPIFWCQENGWKTQRAHDLPDQGCLKLKARLPSQQVWDACSKRLQRTP